MTEFRPSDEAPLVTIPGDWNFSYNYFAGAMASRFFHELKNRRIVGSVCPSCARVLVPARGFCDACFVEATELREVALTGTVECFTILTEPFPKLPEPPLVVGLVMLDGADSAVLNAITGVDLDDLDAAAKLLLSGVRVRAEFQDECEGRITDFHFVVEP